MDVRSLLTLEDLRRHPRGAALIVGHVRLEFPCSAEVANLCIEQLFPVVLIMTLTELDYRLRKSI